MEAGSRSEFGFVLPSIGNLRPVLHDGSSERMTVLILKRADGMVKYLERGLCFINFGNMSLLPEGRCRRRRQEYFSSNWNREVRVKHF